MKVNAVRVVDGSSVPVIIDLSNIVRLEIEVDGIKYQVQRGRTMCHYQDTSLRLTCEHGIVVKPITSNTIEIL